MITVLIISSFPVYFYSVLVPLVLFLIFIIVIVVVIIFLAIRKKIQYLKHKRRSMTVDTIFLLANCLEISHYNSEFKRS